MVLYQTKLFNLWIVRLHQVGHELGVITSWPPRPDFNITNARMRLKGTSETTGSIVGLFIVIAFGFSRAHGEDGTHVFNKKARAFINTNQRSQWIVRQSLLVQDIFHIPYKGTRDLPDVPVFM